MAGYSAAAGRYLDQRTVIAVTGFAKIIFLVKKYAGLTKSRKTLLWQATALQLLVRLAFVFLSFKTVYRWFDRPVMPVARLKRRDKRDILWAVQATAARIPYTTCLTNAFVARFLLGRNGIRSQLHIGVAKKEQDRLDAHAWLTIRGKIVIGEVEDMEQFTALPEITLQDS